MKFVKCPLTRNIFHLKLIFLQNILSSILESGKYFLNNFFKSRLLYYYILIKYKVLHVSNLS